MEAANNAKHVVSISLGSSKRDAGAILELGGSKSASNAGEPTAILTEHVSSWNAGTAKRMPSVWVVRIYMFMQAKSVIPSVNRLI